jgi:predicted lipoprotein with Yx(FWY)xxD motif
MSRVAWLVLVLVATACGAPEPETAEQPPGETESSASAEPGDGETAADPSPKPRRPTTEPGTAVTLGDSPFGQMLFDDRGQAIYLFEPEADGRPACYGDCEAAWPPVLTEGDPVARAGLRQGLLDVVERRDGSRQVTYGGWPLYFYAHEDPGEVLCHDVVLNGGLWLAIGADGQALPT